ncbi:MAG: tetratricopeptide repeat protein [Candidatus Melainabacteria bacterium]|nr:tetratricopeptide repeat protein [Candidatus Melainabacteria bacterium]
MKTTYTKNMTTDALLRWYRRTSTAMALVLLGSCLLGTGALQAKPLEPNAQLNEAVACYRQGKYDLARRQLVPLVEQFPENTKAAYYLAITQANLGQIRAARGLYERIVLLDPESEEAHLAREGLSYLPENEPPLDPPPRLVDHAKSHVQSHVQSHVHSPPKSQTSSTAAVGTTAQAGQAMGSVSSEAGAALPEGISAPLQTADQKPDQSAALQQWMAMQTMMSVLGGNQPGGAGGMGAANQGVNPMQWMLNPALMNGSGMPPSSTGAEGNTGPAFDPEAMSSLLMNQLMQNMSLEGNHNKD